MNNINGDNHLLSLQSFKAGRCIYAYDLRNSDCDDVISVEKSGNVRISMQTSKPNVENLSVFVVSFTTGHIEIDAHRRVRTSYLI